MSAEPQGFMEKREMPGGYVVGAKKVGLLSTVFAPDESLGFFFLGRDDQEVATLPIRHDAQFVQPRRAAGRTPLLPNALGGADQGQIFVDPAAGGGTQEKPGTGTVPGGGLPTQAGTIIPVTQEKFPGDNWIGRFAIRDEDVAGVPEGNGVLVKGYLAWDSSLANTNTFFGHETGQIAVVVRVPEPKPQKAPRDGQPGRDGRNGDDGAPGADGAVGPTGPAGADGSCEEDCECDCPGYDFGNGISGAHVLTGDDAILKNINAASFDLAGWELSTGPDFVVYVSGALTINGGTIVNNGADGTDATVGYIPGVGGTSTSSGTLGAAGAGGNGNGGGAGAPGSNPPGYSLGGGGGAGGEAAFAGGAGSVTTPPPAAYGNITNFREASTGIFASAAGSIAIYGGGGGGGGAGSDFGAGGGGGAGGKRIVISARQILAGTGDPAGSIRARGGSGGAAFSTGGYGAGGGGGGGGGDIVLICDETDCDLEALCDVSGGGGGAGQNFPSGVDGEDGDDGTITILGGTPI